MTHEKALPAIVTKHTFMTWRSKQVSCDLCHPIQ